LERTTQDAALLICFFDVLSLFSLKLHNQAQWGSHNLTLAHTCNYAMIAVARIELEIQMQQWRHAMMKPILVSALSGLAIALAPISAFAAGELNIFNWGDYTSSDMIKKFEDLYDVKVTITDYDSNDTALAKVRAGGHGYDIVVPSSNYIPIWISEGLVLETNPSQMENFKNIKPEFKDVPYDPGRKYSVPYLWGTTGVAVNTSVYKGDIDTLSLIMDPPPELSGKINVVPEMGDVMALMIMYFGGEPCTSDKEILKKVRDKAKEAKPKWLAMDYSNVEKLVKGDFTASLEWNGGAFRARLQNPDIKWGYPKEGFIVWMDNVMVLKDSKNAANAKLFQNFMMTPEAAGMTSSFARYANGITGSEAFMPADMTDAREINIPSELSDKGRFILACSPEVTDMYTKLWTDILN
jgi:spermidine/putrescine transport system substrate-binding protein